MTLSLPRDLVDAMVAHVRSELPNEGCGIIAGKDGVAHKLFATRNAEASPFRYNIHPLDLKDALEEMEEEGWDVLVIYHSHVASEAYPSPTDVRLAQWAGTNPPSDLWPGAYYVLVSLKDVDAPVVRAFTIHAGVVEEVGLAVA
jgi:proteasome lid subunit RPN8/RPN11